tara:strand:+ start:144682 stop:145944 length:1263 start_codon:yes stop_codon:yes gene_type:complete
VFLFHSREDQVTSFANTQIFANQLKQQGTDVEFVAGNGGDHYQTMISEGIPLGIEWIKKIVAMSGPATTPDSQMAASAGKPVVSVTAATTPTSPQLQIDLTRHLVKYKINGFDDFYTRVLKAQPIVWKSGIERTVERGLEDIVPEYTKGSVRLNLVEMTLSFEYLGELPEDIPQKFADNIITQSVKLDSQPLSIEKVSHDPNATLMQGNFLTFRIRNLNRLQLNRNASTKIVEVNLKQINRYVPDSLIINYDEKWAYFKLKGVGDKSEVKRAAIRAFTAAGLFVTPEKINLTETDLAKNGTTETSSTKPGRESAASNTKQKFVIHYGVYGGNSLKIKDSVKRSLKGFVWVDQSSIKINPDAKMISFNNRSAVDNGALERALTRNKFYQLNITQEALPEEKSALDKSDSASEKTEAKAGTK